MPTSPPARSTTLVAPSLGSSVLLTQWNSEQKRHIIRPVDPATGRDVAGYTPIVLGNDERFAASHAFSTDRKKLVAIESHGQSCEPDAGGTVCTASADLLHLIDLQSWREVTTPLSGKGRAGVLSFSPDTTRLALIYHEQGNSTLILLDTGSGEIMTRRALDFPPSLMEYSEDGSTLIVYGTPPGSSPGMSKPGQPRVLLVDAKTLEVEWEQPLPNIISGKWCVEKCEALHQERLFATWRPAVVLSHDRRKLYVAHADEERLTTIDLDARAVRSVEIGVTQGWFEQLLALTADVVQAKAGHTGSRKSAALSLDGMRLYMVGNTMSAARDPQGTWQITETALGLRVIEVESGRQAASQESQGFAIKMAPDGRHLYLASRDERGWWTEVHDANSLHSVTRLTEWEVVATRRLDGQPIVLLSQSEQGRSQLAMLDATFGVIHPWTVNSYAAWVVPTSR